MKKFHSLFFICWCSIFAVGASAARGPFAHIAEVVGFNQTLPLCAQACLTLSFHDCGCELANINCTCNGDNSNVFKTAAKTCTEKACKGTDLQIALEQMSNQCRESVTSTSSATSSTSTSTRTRTSSSATSVSALIVTATSMPTRVPILSPCIADPSAPLSSQCDQTTACVETNTQNATGGIGYFCACRGGYKSDVSDIDPNLPAEWRLLWPGQESRVFVKPGVKCDTLCKDWTIGADGCQEVAFQGAILKRGAGGGNGDILVETSQGDHEDGGKKRSEGLGLGFLFATCLVGFFVMLL